jgi:FMN phosphatase YigB (HAD superfamily)
MAAKLKLSIKETKRVNAINYVVRGHTALGCPGFPLADYNEYVYREFPDFTTEEDVEWIQQLLDLKRTHQFKYILCSNATKEYCETVLGRMNVPFDELFDAYFTTDMVNWVKPMSEYYSTVETEWTKSQDVPIVFIDDSPLNIQALASHPNWTGYLAKTPHDVVKSLKTIHDTM